LRPPSGTASARPVRPCGSVQFNGNLQTVGARNATSRFIDFFNSLADSSITNKLLREIHFSHTIAMSLEHQPLFPRMGFGTQSPLLNNELLTSSHPEMKTQGDLKVSVKEIDDLRRGAVRLSPNGRVSATVSYLSRKL
jgi:hypothetical protein